MTQIEQTAFTKLKLAVDLILALDNIRCVQEYGYDKTTTPHFIQYLGLSPKTREQLLAAHIDSANVHLKPRSRPAWPRHSSTSTK